MTHRQPQGKEGDEDISGRPGPPQRPAQGNARGGHQSLNDGIIGQVRKAVHSPLQQQPLGRTTDTNALGATEHGLCATEHRLRYRTRRFLPPPTRHTVPGPLPGLRMQHLCRVVASAVPLPPESNVPAAQQTDRACLGGHRAGRVPRPSWAVLITASTRQRLEWRSLIHRSNIGDSDEVVRHFLDRDRTTDHRWMFAPTTTMDEKSRSPPEKVRVSTDKPSCSFKGP
jgi:hypothetical protein